MHASQRARFSTSAISVAPRLLSVAGTGGSQASNEDQGQVGTSAGGFVKFGKLFDAHPVNISRANDSRKNRFFTDYPFNGLAARHGAALGGCDSARGVGFDLDHARVRFGQLCQGVGALGCGLGLRLVQHALDLGLACVVPLAVNPPGDQRQGQQASDSQGRAQLQAGDHFHALKTYLQNASLIVSQYMRRLVVWL
jgi:hypothetical protein